MHVAQASKPTYKYLPQINENQCLHLRATHFITNVPHGCENHLTEATQGRRVCGCRPSWWGRHGGCAHCACSPEAERAGLHVSLAFGPEPWPMVCWVSLLSESSQEIHLRDAQKCVSWVHLSPIDVMIVTNTRVKAFRNLLLIAQSGK